MQKKGPGIWENDLENVIELFRLLSDKTRLSILQLLADGERNVTTLCEALSLRQPTVSHHLARLRARNLIVNRRVGKQIIYSLNNELVAGLDMAMRIKAGGYSVEISPTNEL